MNVIANASADELRISLSGRFDFSAHKEFRQGYDSGLADPKIRTVVLEMAQVDYLDSAALGMLLLLQERAASANKQVILSQPRGATKQVLEVANFQKIFTIR